MRQQTSFIKSIPFVLIVVIADTSTMQGNLMMSSCGNKPVEDQNERRSLTNCNLGNAKRANAPVYYVGSWKLLIKRCCENHFAPFRSRAELQHNAFSVQFIRSLAEQLVVVRIRDTALVQPHHPLSIRGTVFSSSSES